MLNAIFIAHTPANAASGAQACVYMHNVKHRLKMSRVKNTRLCKADLPRRGLKLPGPNDGSPHETGPMLVMSRGTWLAEKKKSYYLQKHV